MLNLPKILLYLIFFCITAFTANARTIQDSIGYRQDSMLLEMQRIKNTNEQLRIRDSIRLVILNEELERVKNPQAAESEKYKKELLDIKRKDSLRLNEEKAFIEHLRNVSQPGYVTLFNDTLFAFHCSLGPFNTTHRGNDASEKILAIYKDGYFFKDSLSLSRQQGLVNIIYKQQIISSVSTYDALWEDKNIDSLAQEHLAEITETIVAHRNANSISNIILRWSLVLLTVVGFYFAYRFINFIFAKIQAWLTFKKRKSIKGIRVKNYELLTPFHLLKYLKNSVNALRLLVLILAFYFFLSLLFSIFPYTRNWTYLLLEWIWTPLKDLGTNLLDYLPSLFKVIIIFFIARMLTRLVRFFAVEIERSHLKIKGFYAEWGAPTAKLIRFLIYTFAFIFAFPYLPGSNTEAFRGVSVFIGVLISLGSSSIISNTIAGFIITYMRPFKNGDWIQVKDVVGVVMEKNALVTRLRTINNEDITVPNSSILTNHTTNFSSSSPQKGLVLNGDIKVRYDVPSTTVNQLLIKAAMLTPHIDVDAQPYVFQTELNGNYACYQLNATTRRPDRMYYIKSDLHKNIQLVFAEAKIPLVAPEHIELANNNSPENL